MRKRLGRRRLFALAATALVPVALMPIAGPVLAASDATQLALGAAELAPTALADAAGAQAAAAIPGIFAEAAPADGGEPMPKGDLAPTAAAALLMDASSGQTLWGKNPNARRPVASVTKLMTTALP